MFSYTSIYWPWQPVWFQECWGKLGLAGDPCPRGTTHRPSAGAYASCLAPSRWLPSGSPTPYMLGTLGLQSLLYQDTLINIVKPFISISLLQLELKHSWTNQWWRYKCFYTAEKVPFKMVFKSSYILKQSYIFVVLKTNKQCEPMNHIILPLIEWPICKLQTHHIMIPSVNQKSSLDMEGVFLLFYALD